MNKKIALALVCIFLCLSVVGCSKSDVPDGMKSVSISGEPFVLYVPNSWIDNTSSGISSAYFSSRDNVLITAKYHTPADTAITLDAYVDAHVASLAESTSPSSFDLSKRGDALLGGADARELVFSVKRGESEYKIRQLIAKYNEDIIVLTLNSASAMFESANADFASVIKEFKLRTREADKNDCVTDKKTPEGMKIASADHIEYRFYVPTSWVCNSEDPLSFAYFPESSRPNVSVTSFSPDVEMSAKAYADECTSLYEKELKGFSPVSREDTRCADRDAVALTYTATYGGVKVKVRQTVLTYNGMVYSITYTAAESVFDGHMDDVQKILNAFTFR